MTPPSPPLPTQLLLQVVDYAPYTHGLLGSVLLGSLLFCAAWCAGFVCRQPLCRRPICCLFGWRDIRPRVPVGGFFLASLNAVLRGVPISEPGFRSRPPRSVGCMFPCTEGQAA